MIDLIVDKHIEVIKTATIKCDHTWQKTTAKGIDQRIIQINSEYINRWLAERHMSKKVLTSIAGLASSTVLSAINRGSTTMYTAGVIAKAMDVPIETISVGEPFCRTSQFMHRVNVAVLNEWVNAHNTTYTALERLAKLGSGTLTKLLKRPEALTRTHAIKKLAHAMQCDVNDLILIKE